MVFLKIDWFEFQVHLLYHTHHTYPMQKEPAYAGPFFFSTSFVFKVLRFYPMKGAFERRIPILQRQRTKVNRFARVFSS